MTNCIIQSNSRDFVKNVASLTIASLGIPEIISTSLANQKAKRILLNQDDVILFQGDSITNAGRSKKKLIFDNFYALGYGYVYIITIDLLYKFPDKNLQVYNRGMSCKKVFQLAERWDNNCINLKPNVLSILIGVNDFWCTLNNVYKGSIEIYRNDFKKLLDITKQALPDVKLIIGEPFVVKDVKLVDEKWFPKFDEYRESAREIADQYNAVFIPYQSIFDKALGSAPAAYWTIDGIYPSVAGANLMANAWMEVIKK